MNLSTTKGWTALMAACHHGNVAIADLLLKKEAHHNLQFSENGKSALHYACERGHQHIAELLLRHGASNKCQNHELKTPLETCKREMRVYLKASIT